MKFGCCGNLVASGPDKTGIEIIETAAACGYDYIELPLAEMMELGDGAFEQLKGRVKASGIPCEVCNNLFPARIRLTGPDADMGVIKDYLEKSLGKAKDLGVKTVVFGSGGAKNVPEGFPHDKAYGQVTEVTRMIAPIAKKNGITVVIEPIRKPECNIINTFREGVELARIVDQESIKVLVDYYHMSWEEEAPEVLLEYGREYLRHVHFANPNLGSEEARRAGRKYPASADEWDYSSFLGVLKQIGYQGRVSIEAGADDFPSRAEMAIRFMRQNFDFR